MSAAKYPPPGHIGLGPKGLGYARTRLARPALSGGRLEYLADRPARGARGRQRVPDSHDHLRVLDARLGIPD
jgi:hypothetical protein